ncbi:transposase [Chondrinema litorale]|uniref:transposase n=1 Tax=Chondrinema litorale TaxID=2994555 RepID=UPI002542A425|nr:transposase [Chondrinema litorale]UZR98407.1 transposase [Chondrinema litorale]
MDLANRQILSLINDTSIRAGTLTDYMRWIRNYHYQNLDKKLYLILDNARYQKCDWVKEDAEVWNIELVYLPAYSPNLNLIERLWKWMKKELGKHYCKDKKSFKLQIENTLEKMNSEVSADQFDRLFPSNFNRMKNPKSWRAELYSLFDLS